MPLARIPYLGTDLAADGEKHIVIVYLFGLIAGMPHVLFVRRSDKVMYMKNQWSAIAGAVNHPDLRRQALLEIAGETTLLPNEVSPPQPAGTFPDRDDENNKTWVRNIFVSTVNGRSHEAGSTLGVRLDWEHSEAIWMPVSTVLEWLAGATPEDPVARAILTEEEHTPDFEKNLRRISGVLKEIAAM